MLESANQKTVIRTGEFTAGVGDDDFVEIVLNKYYGEIMRQAYAYFFTYYERRVNPVQELLQFGRTLETFQMFKRCYKKMKIDGSYYSMFMYTFTPKLLF